MTRWLSLFTLIALAAPARADAPAEKKFETWVKALAKRRGYVVCRLAVAQYEPKQTPLHFAALMKKEDVGYREALVFAWGQQRRAFTVSDSQVSDPDCPGQTKPLVWKRDKHVVVGPWGPIPDEHYHLSVVDGELVLLLETENDKWINSGTDWERLSHIDSSTDDPQTNGWAMLPLLPPGSPWKARLPPARTWITFGESAHRGPADAALEVRASLAGKALRLELSAADDVARPLATATVPDATFLRADHFEVWFCAPAKLCDKKTTRQLGVARLADGTLHARWLHPRSHKEPLPVVEAAGPAVVVTIPLAQMAIEGSEAPDDKLEGKLTVAYSDSDTEGKGQETLVATSQVRWADPGSFGLFVRQPGGARFPPWKGSVDYDENEELLADDPPSK